MSQGFEIRGSESVCAAEAERPSRILQVLIRDKGLGEAFFSIVEVSDRQKAPVEQLCDHFASSNSTPK